MSEESTQKQGTKYSGEPDLDRRINLWMQWDRNPETRAEIENLIHRRDWTTLRARLLSRIAFGTAGMRAEMRAGFDSMNDLVVIQIAQGLCEYVMENYPNEEDRKRGVVVGYDNRYHSQWYAELIACVFVQRGLKTFLYGRMVPSSFISFAIMLKKHLAGIMIGASHNHMSANGCKIFWSNGAHVITPRDKEIEESIKDYWEPRISSWDTDVLKSTEFLEDPYEEVFAAYYGQITAQFPKELLDISDCCRLKVVYTALHGVGYEYMQKAFSAANLRPIISVESQNVPNPAFPSIDIPNPEEGRKVFEHAIRKAEREYASTIFATDPDVDRLGVAEKIERTKEWKIFSGNEIATLLGWWSFQHYKKQHPDGDPSECYMLYSTVTTRILATIGEVEGFNTIVTTTGSKWMANLADELLKEGKKVLFACEESTSYMYGTTVLDKDAMIAAVNMATLSCHLRATQGITLLEKLHQIYDEYGYHYTTSSYFTSIDSHVFERVFERLRNYYHKPNTYPQSVYNGKYRIKSVRDLTTGYDNSQLSRVATLPTDPKVQMITFTFEDGFTFSLRTSGTEKKIKYYAECSAPAAEKDWKRIRDSMEEIMMHVVEELLQPKKNGFVSQKVN